MNLRNKLAFFIALNSYVELITRGTSPLSLPDAIADSLSYVKAFGGTEQRNLPDGYTQLEYIVFDSTQVIDTGFTPDNNSRIESKCYRTGASCWFYGASPSNPRVTLFHADSGTCRWGNQSRSYVGTFVADTEYTLIEDKNGININGVDNPWNAGTADDFTCDRTLTIGNCNGATGTRYFAGNLYYMKIYDNDVLVRDFVPCQNASNVVGLYDRVNGVFYTETGLAAGPEAVPTPTTPIDIVSNNGVLKVRHQSGLPLGYTLLEYIESSGTQYIDLDVSGDATFIGTAQSTTDSPTTSQVLFANSGASAGHWFGVQSPGAGSGYAKRWGLGATATASSTIDGTTKVDFEITLTQSSQYGTVNDQVLNRDSSTSAHTNWVVFAGNSTPLYGFIGKVWGLKVVQNNVLVRNLIPAKNSSNVIGMYDLVSGQFFENQGTGDFVAGNVVNDLEIYTDGTVETINVHGKNLFDKNTAVLNKAIESDGSITDSTTLSCTDFIPVIEGQTYIRSNNGTAYGRLYFTYDSNKNFLSEQQPAVSGQPFTIPSGAAYIRFNFDTSVLDILQLERGSTATAYVPYFDGGTATTEMLLKVGNYQDVQSIIDGVVTRNVEVRVLDGTENWGASSTYQGSCWLNLPTTSRAGICVCSHFANVPSVATYARYKTLNEGIAINLWYGDNRTTAVADLKTFLAQQYAAGTPVILLRALNTSTTESVTGQTLQVTGGDNVLEITQASLNNLELEAKYKKRK